MTRSSARRSGPKLSRRSDAPPRVAVCDLDEPVGGSDPHRARAIVREGIHGRVADQLAAVVAERPALRAPVTGAAGARAHPQHAAAILIQRHDVVIAQAVRIVGIAAVAHEGLASRDRRG